MVQINTCEPEKQNTDSSTRVSHSHQHIEAWDHSLVGSFGLERTKSYEIVTHITPASTNIQTVHTEDI